MAHTLDLLLGCHCQVNRHGTGDDSLIHRIRGDIGDKHHTAFEFEGLWQFIIFHICTP